MFYVSKFLFEKILPFFEETMDKWRLSLVTGPNLSLSDFYAFLFRPNTNITICLCQLRVVLDTLPTLPSKPRDRSVALASLMTFKLTVANIPFGGISRRCQRRY